jgi:hypothetical protein
MGSDAVGGRRRAFVLGALLIAALGVVSVIGVVGSAASTHGSPPKSLDALAGVWVPPLGPPAQPSRITFVRLPNGHFDGKIYNDPAKATGCASAAGLSKMGGPDHWFNVTGGSWPRYTGTSRWFNTGSCALLGYGMATFTINATHPDKPVLTICQAQPGAGRPSAGQCSLTATRPKH